MNGKMFDDLPPLDDPRRNIWMRGKLLKGRCLCGGLTYNILICWDSLTKMVNACWHCYPSSNRPDPTKYPRHSNIINDGRNLWNSKDGK